MILLTLTYFVKMLTNCHLSISRQKGRYYLTITGRLILLCICNVLKYVLTLCVLDFQGSARFQARSSAPFYGDDYVTTLPAMSQAIFQSRFIFFIYFECNPRKTLLDILLLRIRSFPNKICALSTNLDYTEIYFVVKRIIKTQP